MKKIEDVKIFSLLDAVKRLGKMKPANGGESKRYSYGGIFSAARRRWPDMRPIPHGLYILASDIPAADIFLESRSNGKKCANLDYKTRSIGMVDVANIKEYAKHYGLSLSAVRKIYYAPGSPLQPYFFEWAGGYALTEAQLLDLVAWMRQYGKRPRRSKFKKSLSHRGGRAPLKTAITETAVKIQPNEEKEL